MVGGPDIVPRVPVRKLRNNPVIPLLDTVNALDIFVAVSSDVFDGVLELNSNPFLLIFILLSDGGKNAAGILSLCEKLEGVVDFVKRFITGLFSARSKHLVLISQT